MVYEHKNNNILPSAFLTDDDTMRFLCAGLVKPEEAVPIKVWLWPLHGMEDILREVSDNLINDLEKALQDLEDLRWQLENKLEEREVHVLYNARNL